MFQGVGDSSYRLNFDLGKNRGGAKTILFGGCKTTFCRQKGVASPRLGRGQSEPYSFLSVYND